MMLAVLREDDSRTARAKGVREARVIGRHVLQHALMPVVTIRGLPCAACMGGTVLMESIVVLPGLGRLLSEAIPWRDDPVMPGLNRC